MSGGLSDLYVLDLDKGVVRRSRAMRSRTCSRHGRLTGEPSRSRRPFSSSLEALRFGQFRLAAVDVQTAVIARCPASRRMQRISTRIGRGDGASLFLRCRPRQISNVYRLDGRERRVASRDHRATGVSGVTALSPALSVCRPFRSHRVQRSIVAAPTRKSTSPISTPRRKHALRFRHRDEQRRRPCRGGAAAPFAGTSVPRRAGGSIASSSRT